MKKLFYSVFYALITALGCMRIVSFCISNNWNLLEIIPEKDLGQMICGSSCILKEIYGAFNLILCPNELVVGNEIILRDGDYLRTAYNSDFDVNEAAADIHGLEEICSKNNTDFIYVFYPSKNLTKEESFSFGVETNNCEYRSELRHALDERDINCIDISERVYEEGEENVFYKTDHHWTALAGLHAANEIMNVNAKLFNLPKVENGLEPENFSIKKYANCWLGETGRKTSWTWARKMDDYYEIVPNYNSSFSVTTDGITNSGTFQEILINMNIMDNNLDRYAENSLLHYAYVPGSGSPTIIKNNLVDEGKVLLIKDSFSVVVAPFLALGYDEVVLWDMRLSPIGLEQYIEANDFDLVMVAYTDFWKQEMYDFE